MTAKKTTPRAKRQKPSVFHRIRTNFLTGLVIVAPVVLTAYLIWTVITFIDQQVVPWVPEAYRPEEFFGLKIPGFGVLIFFIFTAVVGALTKNLFGRQLVRIGEDLVERMPVVRSIYNGLKQIVETILSQSSTTFKKACLVEYPRRGIWAIAFVSTETRGEIASRTEEEGQMLSVFLPTTPNPTSGFLLFVPRKDVVMLDMTVEEAAKLVISAGLVNPPSAAEIAAGRKPAGPGKQTPARKPTAVGR
ncbi:MAG: DUF502 domain-containing protein [Alphaproteobacteria bacterium]|nr:MAG: DUF502 domain-containing protein [Alphaproteobacteria bacterium]